MRRSVSLPLVWLGLLLLPALAACDRPHLHDFLPPPKASPKPIVLADPLTSDLFALQMLSPTEGWAAGAQGTILHYHNGTWDVVKSPMDTYLTGIAMTSPTDGWIVGTSRYEGQKLVGTLLHYTGGVWKRESSPTTLYLDSVVMVSPSEGWAVGKDILHFSGGQWSKVQTPDGGDLSRSGLAMTGTDAGWAVSGDGFIMRYADGQWTEWSQPDPTEKLYAVAMANRDEGWAVGESFDLDGTPTHALLMHYAAGAWTATPAPTDHFLYGVSMVSAAEGWAVGAGGTILHYTAGQWVAAPSPTTFTLRAVQMLSPSEGWAVGVQGTILHYTGGTWTKIRG